MDGASIRLRLRVSPGSTRPGIVGRHGTAWKVRVAAAPERGQANQALLELLAGVLRVPSARLELRRGRTARDKIVEVAGISGDEADRLLSGAAETR